MKRGILLLGIALALFTGCDNDVVPGGNGPEPGMIWDFVNYSICFTVSDAAGNDLLDKNVESNILENDITVTYRTKKYTIEKELGRKPGEEGEEGGDDTGEVAPDDEETGKPQVRFNMPRSLGLRLCENCEGLKYLAFGEFSPQSSYKNEPFTIEWGDGTKDNISFDCYITWANYDPTVHLKYLLNGEVQDRGLIRLVKKGNKIANR